MTYADDVKHFMELAGQKVRTEPTVLTDMEKWQRFEYLNEEFSEMKKALAALKKATEYNDKNAIRDALTELFDAYLDIVYIALGSAHACGFPVNEGWDRVHASNIAKFPGGVAVRDENNKVVKPAGWTPPDLRGLMFPPKH